MIMKVINPILKGFNPDPCICKAKGKYYIATSTFEWFPGVQIYSSDDLVNWQYINSPLDKNEFMDLKGTPDSAGIWAPALSYYNNKFYLIYTISNEINGIFKDIKNYVITADNIEGPWSLPKYINSSGFDPSMYHENGKHYVVNVQWDYRTIVGHKKFNGLILQEFDFEKGLVGKSKVIFDDETTGCSEGPHLMKKDNYYYLIMAQNGTGRHHLIVVARSESLFGPYKKSPYTPLITAWEQETILKKSGHGNFVEDNFGNWYMVHLCSRYLKNIDRCVLGRETGLQRIEWVEGWPRMVQGNSCPALEVEIPNGINEIKECNTYEVYFNEKTNLAKEQWITLRTPFEENIKYKCNGIEIKGGDSLISLHNQSLIARKWSSFNFDVYTSLKFRPYHYSQMAGLVTYYNTKCWYYLYVGYDEIKGKRIINILINDNFNFSEPLNGRCKYIDDDIEMIYLKVSVNQENLQFYYSIGGERYYEIGPALDSSKLSDEYVNGWAYTGATVGINCIDMFNKDTNALFKWFKQIDDED